MAASWRTCPGCRVLIPGNEAGQPQVAHCPVCGTAVAPGGDEGGTWYYAQGRQKQGPVTWEQLRQLVAHKQVTGDAMLLQAGTTKWLPAGSVSGLFAGTPSPVAVAAAIPVAANQDTAPAGDTAGSQAHPPADPAGPLPTVPGYEILKELGRGGMGVVYQARQLGLKRLVALKMILSGVHAGKQELARFRAEAEAVARLHHPHIVQIYEIGEHQGLPYFSLEYVAGGSLDRQLAGKPVQPTVAAVLAETLARAVGAAHQQGIIHRDLKPANVLLSCPELRVQRPEPHATQMPRLSTLDPTLLAPKITDFGLAKQLDSVDGPTRTGAILGTPGYVAPEQAVGKNQEVGPAADIYALGAILYEMLTGRPPFRGDSPLETVLQVVTDEPVPPSKLQPQVPRDLETICLKCLEKVPARRYATAEALADDLQAFHTGRSIGARPTGPVEHAWRWCRRNPLPAGLLVVVTLLLIVVSLGSAFGIWHLTSLSQELVRQTAVESAAQQSEMLESLNNFYSAEVVDRVKPVGVEVTHEYRNKRGAIPLPATMTIDLGNHISEKSQRGMQVRLYSDHPFKSRKDGGPKDEFEWQALNKLRSNPNEAVVRFEDVNGRPTLRYATARLMKQSCVNCHNTHPESTKQNWKVGEVRGVVEIIRPLDRDIAKTQEGLRGTFGLIGTTSAALLLGLSGLVLGLGWWSRRYA